MVERIAAAVREDEVPVSAVLALTFTEKAAGELAERLRRRLTELGEDEHARAVDGAWIGTIHGFCARLLRSQPLAAGLDPRFEVLEAPSAERLAGAAYERALERWARAHGAVAIDLAASFGPALRDLILNAYSTLRARGHDRPRLTIPPPRPAPDPGAAGAGERCGAGGPVPGRRRSTSDGGARGAGAVRRDPRRPRGGGGGAAGGGAARGGAAALAGRPRVPWPGELNAAELKLGAKALQSEPCEAYRAAWGAYRSACADFHARDALTLLDALLDRFGAAYDAAKAERAAVDFDDLELRAKTLLGDARTRERWSERFELIMIDEFQDTNAVQLGILQALERDNLFAVGDEFQSIYRFRHADVKIFRDRARQLPPEDVRWLAVNFRSQRGAARRPQRRVRARARRALLAAARRAARRSPMDKHGALRLFALDPPAGPPHVELLVTATQGWDERAPGLGLAQGGDQPWRRAEARLIADRLRTELSDGRRAGDMVVLVRATSSLRLLEEALEEQGLPTYVVGGRGYWSQEQVRDGLAWLRVLANPQDEEALLTVLSSPFHGAGTDELVLLTAARPAACGTRSRRRGSRGRASCSTAEREHAQRAPLEVLLERAIVATGYDLATLARPGGDRRLANLRKLMRLAGEYERAEGRDLRGFLADAAARDLAEAREGEAALESEGLDAVRLMTIHRAKGLEFPVVCVADLGRKAGGTRSPLLGRPGRHRRPAARPARRRRHDPHARLGAARPARSSRPTPRRSAGCSTSR